MLSVRTESGDQAESASAAGSVESVNVAAAAISVPGLGRTTGIDKHPVDHPVAVAAPGPKGVGGSGFSGDTICELRHHGGDDQAVYAYAVEDLENWGGELGRPLRPGSFGENLTTRGVDLSNALLGERWAVGDSLVLEISDPRVPCRTFAGWLGERGWIRRFTERAAPGSYLRVIAPGQVRAGDGIRVIHRPAHGATVRMAFQAFLDHPELLPRLVGVPSLSTEAQHWINRRVDKQAVGR